MVEEARKIINLYKILINHLLDEIVVDILFAFLPKNLHDHCVDDDFDLTEIKTSSITHIQTSWDEHVNYIEANYCSGPPLTQFFYDKKVGCCYLVNPTSHEWFIVKNIEEKDEEAIKNYLIQAKSYPDKLDIH